MADDESGQPLGGPSPRARLRWLLIVVAVVVLLTAGWPLLNSLVTDKQKLAAGSSLRLGPTGPNSASLNVGPGWTVMPGESDPLQGYLLRRGAVAVSIGYVSLVHAYEAAAIWGALRRLMRVSNPGVMIGPPAAVTGGQGHEGLSATATSARSIGTATVFVGPSGTYAIRIMVLAPPSARPVAEATWLLITRALRFPAAAQSLTARHSRTAPHSPAAPHSPGASRSPAAPR